jgi:hypothetical protein
MTGRYQFLPDLSGNSKLAIRLASGGLCIFPCGSDKKPLVKWRDASTADPHQVVEWWQQWPAALPGIDLAKSNLIVIDADRHGSGDGVAALGQLLAPSTLNELGAPIYHTPGNGLHTYFKQPDGECLGNGRGTLPEGIDVRGSGGYVIAPGAVLPDGRCYERDKTTPPLSKCLAEDALPVLPTILADRLRRPPSQATVLRSTNGNGGRAPSANREAACAAATLDNLVSVLASTGRGGRNNKLNDAAFIMGTMIAVGWIGAAEVGDELSAACQRNGLMQDDGADAVQATLSSGIKAGLEKPHAPLKDRPHPGNGHVEPDINNLSQLSEIAYQRRRKDAAKESGISVKVLDKLVKEQRVQAEEEEAALPHWKVEPWLTSVECAELLDDIKQVFSRYIVLPKGAGDALALWTLHTWTMDAGDISPFLVLVSPTKRCGKTSVLIVLLYLTPRSELASNITASALFRYVEETRPTLLIDEGDSFIKDNEEMRGILNSGHTKAAAHVIRNVEVNGEHKPRRFSTWAPKAIATIRSLADTLEDRAVVVQLQRKPKAAKVARLRKRDNDEFAMLRRKAARWAEDSFPRLIDPEPDIPEALNDRAADNWRPLLRYR